VAPFPAKVGRQIGWGLFGGRPGGGTLDNQVAIDAEGAGGGVGLNFSNVSVHLVEDGAEEGDIAVLHDDMNGVIAEGWVVRDAARHHGCAAAAGAYRPSECTLVSVVLPQAGLGVDAVVDRGTDAIVVGRQRKYLDFVVDRFDARDSLYGTAGIIFEDRTGGVAVEDQFFTLDAEGEPVEYAESVESTEVFLHLFDDPEGVFLGPGGGRWCVLSDDGRSGEVEYE
jgi:hypothetical protein